MGEQARAVARLDETGVKLSVQFRKPLIGGALRLGLQLGCLFQMPVRQVRYRVPERERFGKRPHVGDFLKVIRIQCGYLCPLVCGHYDQTLFFKLAQAVPDWRAAGFEPMRQFLLPKNAARRQDATNDVSPQLIRDLRRTLTVSFW